MIAVGVAFMIGFAIGIIFGAWLNEADRKIDRLNQTLPKGVEEFEDNLRHLNTRRDKRQIRR